MSSTKTHCIDPKMGSLTLCGRKWTANGMQIAQGAAEPTCSHCLKAVKAGAESRPGETPAEEWGFGLRRAVVDEGGDLPCRPSEIVHAHSVTYTKQIGKVVHALEVWWWGYPPE